MKGTSLMTYQRERTNVCLSISCVYRNPILSVPQLLWNHILSNKTKGPWISRYQRNLDSLPCHSPLCGSVSTTLLGSFFETDKVLKQYSNWYRQFTIRNKVTFYRNQGIPVRLSRSLSYFRDQKDHFVVDNMKLFESCKGWNNKTKN